MEAQECVQKASAPFDGKGYIMPKKYEEATDQLNTAKECLQNLHLLLDEILSLPSETMSKYQKLIANYEELVNRIYRIDAEADALISYIDAEANVLISYDGAPRSRRQEIVEKASELGQQLNALDLLIQVKEIPS